MANRFRALTLIAAGSVLVVAGCGSGSESEDVADLSPSQIMAVAKKQVAEEDFVTIQGVGSQGTTGKPLDLKVVFARATASATVAYEGLKYEVLKADDTTYFRANEKYLTSSGMPTRLIEPMVDKWVVVDPGSRAFANLGDYASKKQFIGLLFGPKMHKLTKGKDKRVNGIDCVTLENGKAAMYFAKSDGRPVSLVTSYEHDGALDFSYDKIEEVEAPPSDEVVGLDGATPGA